MLWPRSRNAARRTQRQASFSEDHQHPHGVAKAWQRQAQHWSEAEEQQVKYKLENR
jgi:hypothetical protein